MKRCQKFIILFQIIIVINCFTSNLLAQNNISKADAYFLGLSLDANYFDWKKYIKNNNNFKSEKITSSLSIYKVERTLHDSINFYEESLALDISINRIIYKKIHPEALDSIHQIIITTNHLYKREGKLKAIHQFKQLESHLSTYYKKKVRQSLTGDVAYLFCEGINEHFPDITLSWGWAQKNHNPPTMKFYYTKLMYEKIFKH